MLGYWWLFLFVQQVRNHIYTAASLHAIMNACSTNLVIYILLKIKIKYRFKSPSTFHRALTIHSPPLLNPTRNLAKTMPYFSSIACDSLAGG
jgi:hypothetical protein